MLRAFIVIYLFCFSSLSANAFAKSNVIFMVNMNYSNEELGTLRKIAEARGQEIVVVPPEEGNEYALSFEKTRNRLEKKIKELHPDWDGIQTYNAIQDIQKEGSAKDLSIINGATDETSDFLFQAKKVEELENRLGTMDEQIRNKLKELKSEGKQIDSLVISAHSDGTNLSGETGYNLNGYEVFQLSKDFPEMFQTARHVLLLGCYTMTKSNRKFWRGSIFPNASLIAGFSPRAPSRTDPNNLKFIQDVMQKATELDIKMGSGENEVTLADIRKVFLTLKSITATRYNPVIDYCSYQLEGNPKLKLKCDDEWNLLLDQALSVQNVYLNLENPQKDPPRDTNFSDLRRFYNDLQEICSSSDLSNIPAEEVEARSNYVDSMVMMTRNLIFWWNVQANFSFCHSSEITELNNLLNNAEFESRIPSLDGNTPWTEFVQSMNDIRQTLRTKTQKLKRDRLKIVAGTNTSTNLEEVNSKLDTLEEIRKKFEVLSPLYELNEEIPMAWHNPGVSKSRCGADQW